MTLPPTAPEHQRSETDREIALEDAVTAHNYHPLPVVIAEAEGAWVTDVDGRRYLDCLAGYSALNFGHGHPALLAAARRPARPAHADQPGLPPRPARPVLPRTWPRWPGRTWCCR